MLALKEETEAEEISPSERSIDKGQKGDRDGEGFHGEKKEASRASITWVYLWKDSLHLCVLQFEWL